MPKQHGISGTKPRDLVKTASYKIDGGLGKLVRGQIRRVSINNGLVASH